jgi:hypothetical protein
MAINTEEHPQPGLLDDDFLLGHDDDLRKHDVATDNVVIISEEQREVSPLSNNSKPKLKRLKLHSQCYDDATDKINSDSKKNNGEKHELLTVTELLYLIKTKKYDKLVNIFGDQASEGIEILDMETRTVIKEYNEITKKAKPLYKADCIIRIIKTGALRYISIKSKDCSNASIVNVTRRSMVYDNPDLNKYIASLDVLTSQYLSDPDNICMTKSEVDRKLSSYELSDSQKNDIASFIAYYMFKGTGKGTSEIPADSILEYSKNELNFIYCETEDNKKDYVFKNWNRYVLSIRGHKRGKSGNIRGNGLLQCGPQENDHEWVCYYTENGETLPRGSIAIRIS